MIAFALLLAVMTMTCANRNQHKCAHAWRAGNRLGMAGGYSRGCVTIHAVVNINPVDLYPRIAKQTPRKKTPDKGKQSSKSSFPGSKVRTATQMSVSTLAQALMYSFS